MLAGIAVAFSVNGTEVVRVLRVLDDDAPLARQHRAVAGDSSRQHAVEHIHAAQHALQQAVRRTDAHQVARLVDRHVRRDFIQHLIHHGLGLADRQSADAVADEVHIRQRLGALNAQILVERALHDAKQRLILLRVVLLAALRPAVGALHVDFRGVVIAGVRAAHVERHADIRP